MVEMKFKLKTPSVPNYITVDGPPGPRQDGFKENSISIADVPDELLIELADEWKKELLAKAHDRRNPKDEETENTRKAEKCL